ncbi:2-dehydropantoate 2-reductase [Steroidobacter sp. S1-65]|uniref:2-dehydropantoate 2-reductase n=1 Tax=Steroidobacter gossypii TaxID=2805490 RepID=A0ABS1WRS5_9GAMM|nr:2-dehydropantoate 2-reductase [Steroidobacter gossypii]MBM0103677.1 2-dehydropantoate 2-reductase [Steroidobacter gossypii]
MTSILIVGAGAVGALFGSALARQGAQVSVVCRSDYEVVSREGYDITSPLLGNHRFKPHQVFREVAECKTPPEFLILTVKVLEGVDRAALIRPAVGPGTVIVLIENGIDIEGEIAAAFAENELLSGLALVGVGRGAPGKVDHQMLGQLNLGRYPEGPSAAADRLAAMFNAGGIGCKVTENVVGARWQKAVWNATFNPVSITGGMLDTAVMLGTPESTAFIRRAMQEVCAIAAAAGHPMHPKLIEQLIEGTRAIPPYHTSMALDYKYRRPMEIEAILGNTVRAARKHGVSAPILETLYALTKMIEARLSAAS